MLVGRGVLVMELSMSNEDLVVEAEAFVAKETGKYSVMVGEEVQGGELGKEVSRSTIGGVGSMTIPSSSKEPLPGIGLHDPLHGR